MAAYERETVHEAPRRWFARGRILDFPYETTTLTGPSALVVWLRGRLPESRTMALG